MCVRPTFFKSLLQKHLQNPSYSCPFVIRANVLAHNVCIEVNRIANSDFPSGPSKIVVILFRNVRALKVV